MLILGIETSCDETSAALVENGQNLLSHVVASSAKLHQKYGGIVPEVAARKQVEAIIPVLTETLKPFNFAQINHSPDIDAIAVTIGPGLIGSLLVGVETAKTLAYVWQKPLIPVNHVLAHIYAVFLREHNTKQETRIKKQQFDNKTMEQWNNGDISFPAIALVVSGGHTELYLMSNEKSLKWLGGTLDDAAGECFDKTARVLGLPYPGGPAIAAAAAKSQITNYPLQIKLPRPMINDDSLNFSFSGLKTAVLREWDKLRHFGKPEERIQKQQQIKSGTSQDDKLVSAFAQEIQESITDVLVNKTLKAAKIYQAKSLIITGGVAANQRLREKFNSQLTTHNLQLFMPPAHFCVDSAAYIAAYAYFYGTPHPWHTVEAQPDLSVEV